MQSSTFGGNPKNVSVLWIGQYTCTIGMTKAFYQLEFETVLIWVATKGGGLHRLDTKSMQFEFLNTKNGLPNDVIYSVLNDEQGSLWLSSNKGIIRYQPSTRDIRQFTADDGLQSDEFNTYAYGKGQDGTLYFGGIKGLNAFHPRDLGDNPIVPKVQITQLEVNNQAIQVADSSGILAEAMEYTQEIQLAHHQNNFSLSFAALEFSAPFKNQFSYYLEGAEAPWSHQSTDHKATYLNQPPGRYTFKLKAANGDGVWNEVPVELKIRILPPWYLSTFAYIFYGLLALVVGWQLSRFQRKRIELRHAMELEQQKSERLKELDEAKSRIYTNITHEFRTPLTVISGLVSQMDDDRSYKDPIQRNSDQLLNLVNQMLDLRKLESGKLKLHYQQIDMIRYLRYLVGAFQSYADSKQITLHFLPGDESLLMDVDQEKLTRIVYNLLSNALKFTEANGHVYVRTDLQVQQFLLEVKDTGRGIPEEALPNIFNQFYQVDDSSTRKGEGTGIGLTLVKELIKTLDGSIDVESKVGRGTTFKVSLPITNTAPLEETLSKDLRPVISQAEQEAPQVESIITNDAEDPEHRPNVLIVEDNADVIHYLINCLKADYDIEIAMNGAEGIQKAIDNTPDIIVSDVMMPIKDGFELCQTLKTDMRSSHIPIILLTAKADMDARLEGLQRGADAYLNKPFHQQELLIVMQNQLRVREQLQNKFGRIGTSDQPIDQTDDLPLDLSLENAFLQQIRALVETDLSNTDFGMLDLMRGLGMSRSQIHRKVKVLTGQTPTLFIRSIRLFHAKQLLQDSEMNISEIAYETGFRSPSYFSKLFLETFGTTPSATRK
ncbi:MAG: ATP-binding protein, partial [Bacteroidota bacterium]